MKVLASTLVDEVTNGSGGVTWFLGNVLGGKKSSGAGEQQKTWSGSAAGVTFTCIIPWLFVNPNCGVYVPRG
jgi:hypothetical protein